MCRETSSWGLRRMYPEVAATLLYDVLDDFVMNPLVFV